VPVMVDTYPDFHFRADRYEAASQWPSWVMPICVTSNFWGSSTDNTDRAELSDTSCSPERPPNSKPKRILVMILCL
jgi:hypothetical protein